MKSALSDFILGKKGIYGILHIIILVMSLFLVISISAQMIGWSACAAQRKNAQFSKMKLQPFYPASST